MSYNVKTKVYPNGYSNSTFCNKCIFNPPKKKKLHNSNGDENKQFNLIDELNYEKQNYNTSSENAEQHTDSLKRAKDKVFDIAFCNEWNYFLTITFDDKIVNASEISLVMDKVKNWLNNCVKRKGLKYLLLPEYHKKGNRIHCHALVNDVLDFKSSNTYVVPNFSKPVSKSKIEDMILAGKILIINNATKFIIALIGNMAFQLQ